MPKNAGKPIRKGKDEIIGRPEEVLQDKGKNEKTGNN